MKGQTHQSMLPQELWIGVHTGNHRRLKHCPVPSFGFGLHYWLPAVLAIGWAVENHAIMGTPNSGKEKKKTSLPPMIDQKRLTLGMKINK